jgi:hypothetical protein
MTTHWRRDNARACNSLRRSDTTEDVDLVDCGRCRRILQGGTAQVHHRGVATAPGSAGGGVPAGPPPTEREAWLEKRRRGLGGSDVAAVLGLPGSYRGAHSVWRDKRGLDAGEPDTDRDLLALGLLLEGAILEHAGATKPGGFLAHPEHPWIVGTPDGYGPDGEIIDAKLVVHGNTATRALQWEMQGRWYMALTGAPAVRFVALHLPRRLPVETIAALHRTTHDPRAQLAHIAGIKGAEFTETRHERDLALEQKIIAAAGAWWQTYVVEGNEPPADGDPGTGRWLDEEHTPARGDWLNRPDLGAKVARFHQLGQIAREAEAERLQLGQEIKQAVGDAHGIRGAWGSCSWSRWTKRRTNFDRLREERPDVAAVLDAYTTQEPTGRLYPRLRE